jgi:hypothetical protein
MKVLLSACLSLALMTTYAQDKTVCPMLQKTSTSAEEKSVCPMLQNTAEQHASGVNLRGDHAMGFSHENTKHHFKLMSDGGIIEVDANNITDIPTRDQIRKHLTHITSMFSSSNFEMPMFIHDTVPPGVPVMKEKHSAISYSFIPTQGGAMVRIVTHDPDALKAVHEFLAFQIKDHRTGDSAIIETPSQSNLP